MRASGAFTLEVVADGGVEVEADMPGHGGRSQSCAHTKMLDGLQSSAGADHRDGHGIEGG